MAEDKGPTKIGASRSIYYSLTDEMPDLTDEEKAKLEAVMQKVQAFEAEEANRMRLPVEGQLYKYTNVMKGWQYRWFVLTPDAKMLEYYMLDDKKKSRPRGALHLEGATVSLSDEDNQSFAVSTSFGEVYKLKASDAKEREFWADKIRSVVESKEVPRKSSQIGIPPSPFSLCSGSSTFHVPELLSNSPTQCPESTTENIPANPLLEIRDSMCAAVTHQKQLAKAIESLPLTEANVKCSDYKLLLIKAISQASVQSLEQCYFILRKRWQCEALCAKKAPTRASVESLDKTKSHSSKKEIKKMDC